MHRHSMRVHLASSSSGRPVASNPLGDQRRFYVRPFGCSSRARSKSAAPTVRKLLRSFASSPAKRPNYGSNARFDSQL